MRSLLIGVLALWSFSVFAIPCDCEVRVYSPMTGSHRLPPTVLKTYQLEEFSSYAPKSQRACRELCLESFQEDMPTVRLKALLLTYSERLIDEGVLGYNCTGLTTLKYPIRVKAILGRLGLGNVADFMQVVNHEESCF